MLPRIKGSLAMNVGSTLYYYRESFDNDNFTFYVETKIGIRVIFLRYFNSWVFIQSFLMKNIYYKYRKTCIKSCINFCKWNCSSEI